MNLQKYFPNILNAPETLEVLAPGAARKSVKKLTNLNGKHYFRLTTQKQVIAKSKEFESLNARDALFDEFMENLEIEAAVKIKKAA